MAAFVAETESSLARLNGLSSLSGTSALALEGVRALRARLRVRLRVIDPGWERTRKKRSRWPRVSARRPAQFVL